MVRVAIAGVGGISRRHVDALRSLPSVKITAVTDVVTERAEAVAAACGATAYRELGPCLDNADALYILTPPSTHRDLALAASQAGKHIFLEKPISISIEDAVDIVEITRKAKVKLMMGFNMRFRKGGLMLKETMESGLLGSAYNFWIHRMGPLNAGYNWRTDPTLLCGVAIESISHDIDQVRWIAGEIKDVRATIFESRADLPGYDTDINCALSLANGTMALMHVSWASPLGHNARGLIGTEGSVMIDGPNMWDWQNLHTKTKTMPYETISVINDMLGTTPSYTDETKHFIECIENNSAPSIGGEDGLRALQVSHAILKSAHEGIVVQV